MSSVSASRHVSSSAMQATKLPVQPLGLAALPLSALLMIFMSFDDSMMTSVGGDGRSGLGVLGWLGYRFWRRWMVLALIAHRSSLVSALAALPV